MARNIKPWTKNQGFKVDYFKKCNAFGFNSDFGFAFVECYWKQHFVSKTSYKLKYKALLI